MVMYRTVPGSFLLFVFLIILFPYAFLYTLHIYFNLWTLDSLVLYSIIIPIRWKVGYRIGTSESIKEHFIRKFDLRTPDHIYTD